MEREPLGVIEDEPSATKTSGRQWFKAAVLLGVGGVVGLLVAYWYMVKCTGEWHGTTLESEQAADLGKTKQKLKEDIAYMQQLGPRNSENDKAYAQLQACADWISTRWRNQGYTVRTQQFFVDGRPYRNLEIEIPGAIAPEEIVLISAQYDTLPGSPGANNNASGAAALFQVSEFLRGRHPARTVRLVEFANEEDPFFGTPKMGSYVYAASCRERGDKICGMLSLDSIGIYKHTPGSQKLPWPFSMFYPDRGDFLGFIGNLPSRQCVKVATKGFQKATSFAVAGGLAPAWVPGVTWSDHSSFWKFGYPGVQVTDTGAYRASSHTTGEDTLDKIDFDSLARVSLGICGAALELADKQNEPGWDGLPGQWLLLNATVVMLTGLLVGWPMRLALIHSKPEKAYHAWRVAHATLITYALAMFAVALTLPQLVVDRFSVWLIVWSLVAAGYAFVFAMTAGAWTGLRGLAPKPWGLNTIFFTAHAVGAIGSTTGFVLVLRGAWSAL